MTSTKLDELREKSCEPCEGKTAPLSRDEAERMVALVTGWELAQAGKSIRREWVTADFDAAMKFLDAVARVAEGEDHHPDLHLTDYRNVAIELSTHAIGGLSENDFILAAKINDLPVRLKQKK